MQLRPAATLINIAERLIVSSRTILLSRLGALKSATLIKQHDPRHTHIEREKEDLVTPISQLTVLRFRSGLESWRIV